MSKKYSKNMTLEILISLPYMKHGRKIVMTQNIHEVSIEILEKVLSKVSNS